MNKIKWLILLSALTTAGTQRVHAQDINVISSAAITLHTCSGGWSSGNAQVFDAQGNMYFVSSQATVSKYDAATNAVTIYAGTSGSCGFADGAVGTGELNLPLFLAIDNTGNLYISDALNFRVRKVNTSGVMSTVAGNGSYGYGGDGHAAISEPLGNPAGIAIDGTGNLYIADASWQTIRKVDSYGIITTIAGTPGTTGSSGDGGPPSAATFSYPAGICLDATGNLLYIADPDNEEIRLINFNDNLIKTFAGTGTAGYTSDGIAANTSELSFPVDVKIGCDSSLYIADFNNYRIRKVDNRGVISTFAGTGVQGYSGNGGSALSAKLNSIGNLSIDNIGNVYTGDFDSTNEVIRIVCEEYALPTVTIAADAGNCSNTSSNTFSAGVSSSCASNLIYDWVINGVDHITNNPYYTDYSPVSGHSVTCIVSYNTNAINSYCSSATTTSNTVYEVGTDHPVITGIDITNKCSPGFGSAPEPYVTSAVSGGVGTLTYLWSSPVVSGSHIITYLTPTSPNTTITAANSGPSSIVLSVTDANGCVKTVTDQITFLTSGWDLATKDNPFDLYEESYTASLSTDPLWNDICHSQDIWNRITNDGTTSNVNQTANYRAGLDDYMYVNVRNVGCDDFSNPACSSNIAVVNTYWTLGGFGGTERWTEDWTGASGTGPSTTTYVSGLHYHIGGSSGSFTVPSIAAGYSAVVGHMTYASGWTPPDVAAFTSGYVNIHLCYLSRIVDYHNSCVYPGMTSTETIDNSSNVRNNNNISTRNTDIIQISTDWGPAPPGERVFVGNPEESGNPGPKVSVQFANRSVLNGTGPSSLSSYASFKVKLGALYGPWVAAGKYGTYNGYSASDSSVIFDGSTTLTLDSLTLDTGTLLYPITIYPSIIPGANGNAMPLESIVLRSFTDDTGLVLGSYTFDVRYDTTPPPKGVLAITEISQGTTGHNGCEYAELLVSACDTVPSALVDVRGWILDDNSGNFDGLGCTSGYGITRGHYRLAYDSIWQYMRPGSTIVVYNQAINCYSLPDTFYIDTTHLIYYVPVPSTAPGGSYVLQRYSGTENLSMCSYCSDTGTTVYSNASNWAGTIDLNNTIDAVQVRCPGCTTHNPGTPAFYNGIGYAPSSLSGFANISSTSGEIGGPYVTNSSLGNRKYTFVGTVAADFDNASMWTDSAANIAGSRPATLGYVDSALYFASRTNTLGLPCCGGVLGERHSITSPNHGGSIIGKNQPAIKVYPNPATMTVNFEFPQSANITIRLMDITGRVLSEQQLEQTTKTTFDISSFKPGLYLYQVATDNMRQTGKIVVE